MMQEILTSCSRLTVSVLQQNSLTGAQVVYLVTLQCTHKIFKLLVGEISFFSFFCARLQSSAQHSGLLSGWKLSLLLFLRQKRPLQPHIIMQYHGGSASHPATRKKKPLSLSLTPCLSPCNSSSGLNLSQAHMNGAERHTRRG